GSPPAEPDDGVYLLPFPVVALGRRVDARRPPNNRHPARLDLPDRARAELRCAPQCLYDEPRCLEHDRRLEPAARTRPARRAHLHHSLLRLVLAGQGPRPVRASPLRLRLPPLSATRPAQPDTRLPRPLADPPLLPPR